MKILVTGGAGYLGAVLVPLLLRDDNHEVTVIDSFAHGVPSLAALAGDRHLRVVRGDAQNAATLRPLVHGVDVVVALAGVVGAAACARDVDAAYAVNAFAIERLVGFLSPDQALVYPMTNSGYGLAGEAECTEASPLAPTSAYGRSKVLGERFALGHPRAASLRFATLFGASARLRFDLLVNDLVYRAVSGEENVKLYEGEFRRNFLHVYDAARAIDHVARKLTCGKPMGEIYNTGDDRANLTKRALCELIRRHVPAFTWVDGSGADPDRRDYVVSSAKILATGWQPLRSLDDGVEELIRAYAAPFDGPGYRN